MQWRMRNYLQLVAAVIQNSPPSECWASMVGVKPPFPHPCFDDLQSPASAHVIRIHFHFLFNLNIGKEAKVLHFLLLSMMFPAGLWEWRPNCSGSLQPIINARNLAAALGTQNRVSCGPRGEYLVFFVIASFPRSCIYNLICKHLKCWAVSPWNRKHTQLRGRYVPETAH